jgi:hypothetical protein
LFFCQRRADGERNTMNPKKAQGVFSFILILQRKLVPDEPQFREVLAAPACRVCVFIAGFRYYPEARFIP